MRTIGLHFRITKNIIDIAERAKRINLSSFQCFLVHQKTKKHLDLSAAEYSDFLKLRNTFTNLYIHGAYWINLCGNRFKAAQYLLNKEIAMAKRLGFSHYVLHPGSATGWENRIQGIDCLAKILDVMAIAHPEITIVLENTAHAGKTIGSDIEDFSSIREKLDYPEKIKFCIDTAHAHSFGYDIITLEGQKTFIDLLEKTIGIDSVALIHLNDNKELAGIYRDKHALLGQGEIGSEALKSFMQNSRLSAIPIILELPDSSDSDQENMVKMVHQWHENKKERKCE